MHIIAKKKIRDYLQNTQAEIPLTAWYYQMKAASANNFSELKMLFNSVDYVSGYTIFDVGGNNYRLITAVHYKAQRCYVRQIWTHAEYSKSFNQDKLIKGDL